MRNFQVCFRGGDQCVSLMFAAVSGVMVCVGKSLANALLANA